MTHPFNKNKSKLQTLKSIPSVKKIIPSNTLQQEIKAPLKYITNYKQKTNEVHYLEKNIKSDLESIQHKYEKLHICLYTIHFINNNPYLLYIFEKKTVDSETIITFPIFSSGEIFDKYEFLEKLKLLVNLKVIYFKGYLENNESLFLFYEYKSDTPSLRNKKFVPLSMYEICLTKKYYNMGIHESINDLFSNNRFLIQLYNEYGIAYPIPIVCYYEVNLNIISDYFGPLKIKNSYYNLYCFDSNFSHIDNRKLSIEHYLNRAVIFLTDAKYIFSTNSELDIDSLSNNFNILFIGTGVYTEKTLKSPGARIIVRNISDFVILK